MRSFDAVLSAVPYRYNLELTRCAIAAGTHFADLGGNSALVDAQRALDGEAKAAGVVVLPDLGVAPGLAGLLGADLVRTLEPPRRLHLRVGGLPRARCEPLGYRLVFSVSGLVNEYIEPCRVIRDGRVGEVPGLSELESIDFAEPWGRLEAFQTSGGTSTLVESLLGEVVELDYKTIRYPGHRDQIKLLQDLGLFDSRARELTAGPVVPRELTELLLCEKLGQPVEDVLLLRITAEGKQAGQRVQLVEEMIVSAELERCLSAMSRATGYPAAVITAWLGRGEVEPFGVHCQENVLSAARLREALAERGLVITRTQVG
jgi:lysine 6-dehydrogenase